jgi:C-terminal processing protease CtpA/Prc
VPFGPEEAAAEVAFLCGVLREGYAHLETKRQQWGLDLGELCSRYGGLIRRADTWERHERVMVAFVSELHDAHVGWRRQRGANERRERPRRIVRLGIETRFVGDVLVVADVWPGSGAERAGLRVGDVIAAIDGRTIEERMGGRSGLRSWSRRESARYDFADEWPAERVGADEALRPRHITRERDDGTYEGLSVEPETKPRAERDRRALVLDRRDGVAILSVRTLGGPVRELEARLDEMARELDGAAAKLVLDLRGNPGGHDKAARAIAARLTNRPVTGGEIRVRLSKWAREAHAQWNALAEDPQRPGWSVAEPVHAQPAASRIAVGKTVVLVDAGCRSSCEALALPMRAMDVPLVGERTGGSSGAPFTVTLPHSGARVTISGWAMSDAKGDPIEGRGIAPDETVLWTRADIIERRDPVLARAIARLGS